MRPFLAGLTFLALVAAQAAAVNPQVGYAKESPVQLVINSAEPDFNTGQLVIEGKNFGTEVPSVFLSTIRLVVSAHDANMIVAELPSGLYPGSYRLVIWRGVSATQIGTFVVTLGAVGPEGPMGPEGLMGPRGFDGVQGPTGPMGPRGPQGPDGPMGPRGFDGPQGIQGPTGPIGPQGLVGPQGPVGQDGPQGPIGPDGPQGAIGQTGPQGPIGPAGPQGPVGQDGPQGIQGPDGPIGPQGLDGPQGPQGSQGPRGFTGPQGPIGPDGPQGPQGPIGPRGLTGLQGPPGLMGPQGPTGPQGPSGFSGYEIVSNECTFDEVFYGDVVGPCQASCPAGKVVVGGGAVSAPAGDSLLAASNPICVGCTSSSGWETHHYVLVVDPQQEVASLTVTTYGACVNQ